MFAHLFGGQQLQRWRLRRCLSSDQQWHADLGSCFAPCLRENVKIIVISIKATCRGLFLISWLNYRWGMGGGLTNAGLRVACTSFLHRSLTHDVIGLAGSAAHLDSAATFLAAHGPAAPTGPALCRGGTTRGDVLSEAPEKTFRAERNSLSVSFCANIVHKSSIQQVF